MAVDGPLPSGGAGAEPREEGDLYTRLKTLQRQLEFLDIQEEYIKARRGLDAALHFCLYFSSPPAGLSRLGRDAAAAAAAGHRMSRRT